MPTTWTGHRYPDPEHMLLCLGSGVNYKPVRAYKFYRIVIGEFDEIDEEESLEQALKQLSITKSDIISDDLEYWQQYYTWKIKN
nr:hypothetical protein [Tanacetum cinerariifolium]